jgi:HSP20 family molecular chaperone IbpA
MFYIGTVRRNKEDQNQLMPLIKYAPFADVEDFPAGLRLFQDSVNRLFSDQPGSRPWTPAVDILETDNELVLKADVPGVEQKDIDIQLENGTLTVKGERKFSSEAQLRFVRKIFHGSREHRRRACSGRFPEWRPDRDAAQERDRKTQSDQSASQ